MKKINTALFCLFVLLFCSCDVLNKAPLDEIADDSFWSDCNYKKTAATIPSRHSVINTVQAGLSATMTWSVLPIRKMTTYGKIIT